MLVHLNHKVHVLFRRQDLDMVKLEGKIVVVLDVLFATSTMIAALGGGASEVIPTLNEEQAREQARNLPAGSYVLAGELFAETIPGFAPPTPLALLEHDVGGRTLIYATTNGTVALKESAGGAHVFAGALLNADAVVRHIAQRHPDGTILIVCSGLHGQSQPGGHVRRGLLRRAHRARDRRASGFLRRGVGGACALPQRAGGVDAAALPGGADDAGAGAHPRGQVCCPPRRAGRRSQADRRALDAGGGGRDEA